MHLLYLCNEYPPFSHGGIGVKYQTIARRLVNTGWQVSVIGTYPVQKAITEDDEGVKVIRIPVIKKRGLASLLNAYHLQKAIKKVNRQHAIDLIETSELGFGLLPADLPGMKIIRMSGGHTFFSVTLGNKPRFWRQLIEKRSFALADHFCAVSRYVGETTRALMKMGDRQITVLPNPVDPTLFRPHPEIEQVKNSILFVGTLTEKKGIRQLIQAMPLVKQVVPDACLTVVGRDTNDKKAGRSYQEGLIAGIPDSLADSIQFTGPLPNAEVAGRIAQAQVCVYPSHMEAQGIVVVEGLASGKAVVASKLGPGPELIDDGINGLLCDPHSPESIAEKIIQLLTDDALRYSISHNARKKAVEQFSVDVMIEKNMDFYQYCLGSINK